LLEDSPVRMEIKKRRSKLERRVVPLIKQN